MPGSRNYDGSVPAALGVVSRYMDAMANRDAQTMDALRAPDFVLDFVHGDAFEDGPLSAEDTRRFWPSWFAAFPEMDLEVTRTIAAETVVVVQWIVSGTQSGTLGPPIFDRPLPATGRTIRFRGVSVYDVTATSILRETMYLDLATLMVELGVTP